MKKTLSFFLLVMTAACSSAPKVDKSFMNETTIYRINDVTVKLESKCEGKQYPNQEELSAIIKEQIKSNFCEVNVCAQKDSNSSDIVDINIDIFYQRVFMGEGFKCSENYATNQFSYSFNLKKNNNIMYESTRSNMLVTNHGLFGNFKKIGTQLTLTGNKDDESKDIAIITYGISKRITNFISE